MEVFCAYIYYTVVVATGCWCHTLFRLVNFSIFDHFFEFGADMKIVSIFALYAVIFIVAYFGYSSAQNTQKPSSNGTRKLQITENSNPQVSYGTAFDEITVESNLNIRGKNPSSRSQRTQLFPVKTANASDTKANENKPNNIKLATNA